MQSNTVYDHKNELKLREKGDLSLMPQQFSLPEKIDFGPERAYIIHIFEGFQLGIFHMAIV